MTIASDVAVLWVDPRGPYPRKVQHWWDAERDAWTYNMDLPVVVHPPCGPWGGLKHLSKKDAPEHAPMAITFVRAFGGVLEHPAGSLLWNHLGLHRPGDQPDIFGGYSIEVCQVNWGHVARKRTWLYICGCPKERPPTIPPDRVPTHWISGFKWTGDGRPNKKRIDAAPNGIKICSAQQRRRTPDAFADWLIEVARRCGQRR